MIAIKVNALGSMVDPQGQKVGMPSQIYVSMENLHGGIESPSLEMGGALSQLVSLCLPE